MGLFSYLARKIQSRAAAPTTAVEGDIYYDTTNHLAYVATAPNTFTALDTGTGDVVGPGSSTDKAIVRWNGATGLLTQNSVVTVSDVGDVTGVGSLSLSSANSYPNAILDVQGSGLNAMFRLNNTGSGGRDWMLISSNTGASTPSALRFFDNTATADRWFINSSGHFMGGADNTYDIGASAATRPRTGYFGTSLITPLVNGTNYTGTATNNNSSAGSIGELLTASLASGSATSLTTVTPKTITSVSLTAGDWDVWGVVDYVPAATTTTAYVQQGTSTTNNTLGGQDTFTACSGGNLSGTVLGSLIAEAAPHQRMSLAGTTTVYLVANASFAVSTMTAYGSIFARRRR